MAHIIGCIKYKGKKSRMITLYKINQEYTK